jgi:transposase InsO family protein
LSTNEQLSQTLDQLGTALEKQTLWFRMDNGKELTAHGMRDWCRLSRIDTGSIEPGAPWQNPFSESFNDRFEGAQNHGQGLSSG